jgi:iron complex outermembrane receptor protein
MKAVTTILLTLSFTSIILAQTSAPPTDADATLVLPSFQVNSSTDKGYLAGNSVSSSRIDTPIKELPFAVSAFTQQFITDIGARELFDVVKYSAGVMSGSSEFLAGDTSFSIRGFKQPPEHDGFFESGRGNVYVDTSNVERVEVVKGPAALLYGAVAPGGTVNYITKKPEDRPFVSVNTQYGSYDFARATVDINEPLIANTLLFRFNSAFENGSEWVEGTDSKTKVFAPALTWKISPTVSLRVNYQYFDRKETPPAYPNAQMEVATPASEVAAMTPGAAGPSAALTGKTGIDAAMGYGSDGSNPGFLAYYPLWPKNENYLNNSDSRTTNLQSFDVELDAALNRHLNSRLNFNFSHTYQTSTILGQSQIYLAPSNSLVFNNGVWGVAPSWTAMTAAQQLAAELTFAQQVLADVNTALQPQNGTPGPAIIPKVPTYSSAKSNTASLQWEVAGEYDFPWGKLKPVGGVFWDASGLYSYGKANTGGAASPFAQSWDVNPASPTFFIDRTPAVNVASLTNITSNTFAWNSDQAVYGALNASLFHEKLFFVGGLRYNLSQTQATNFAAASSLAVGRRYEADKTTPQIGMGYRVLPNLMLYASYSTAYSLPSTPYLSQIEIINGQVTSTPTTPAVPTTATSYEVGVKTDFLNGRISSTLSLYDITQKDVVQTVNSFINGGTYASSVQQTKVRSTGIELETTLSPLDNWQVFLSAAYDNARNVAEPLGDLYYLGEPPPYTARQTANLWTRYSFMSAPIKGLWVGGGFNYQGRMQGDTVNKDDYLPPVCIWNVATGYDWTWDHTKMNATLNLNNLTNEFYVPATQIRGMPRNIVASITAKF